MSQRTELYVHNMGKLCRAIKNVLSEKRYRNGKEESVFARGVYDEQLQIITYFDWFTVEGNEMWAEKGDASLQDSVSRLPRWLSMIEAIDAKLDRDDRATYWWQIVMTHTAALRRLLATDGASGVHLDASGDGDAIFPSMSGLLERLEKR